MEVEVGSSSVIMVEVDQGGEREGGGGLTVDTVRILRLVLWPVQDQRAAAVQQQQRPQQQEAGREGSSGLVKQLADRLPCRALWA